MKCHITLEKKVTEILRYNLVQNKFPCVKVSVF